MKTHYKIQLFFIILLGPILVKASIEDTALARCYQLERSNTELAIKHINQNELDSLDLLYQSLPLMCNEYAWNRLIKVFLMCTKYPQQIDSIVEPEMEFIITYVSRVKNQKFVYGKGEKHDYIFSRMPTFLSLHDAVQVYLKELYNTLPIGTKQFQIVGTLIGKHTLFFDNFNKENSNLNQYGNLTIHSLESQKKEIRKGVFLFLSLSTSMAINKQLGNSIQCDYLGLELKVNQTLIGLSYGFGFNITDPNYIIRYNDKVLKPNTRVNWACHFWYNRLLFKESFINPYIGGGFGIQYRFGSQDIGNYSDVRLSITTVQLYPEVGFLIGNWPNYVVKLHGSYRLSGYWGSYYGDIPEGELSFVGEPNLNEWRIGLSILIDIARERRQQAKIVGLW